MMNFIDVGPVPTLLTEPPWDATISTLDNHLFAIAAPSPEQLLLGGIADAVWGVSLHWLYRKKWSSKHKVPGHRTLKSAVEPFGEVLRALLELAIQTHAVGAPSSKRYTHACHWFRLAAPELRAICFSDRGSKTELVADLREILAALKDLQNPFLPWECPHLYGLIEAAISIAEKNDRYHNEYWRGLKSLKPKDGRSRGLIYALSGWANALETNSVWSSVQITESGLFARVGSGRGTLKIGG
jgi:hypothetical protein